MRQFQLRTIEQKKICTMYQLCNLETVSADYASLSDIEAVIKHFMGLFMWSSTDSPQKM